MTLNQPGGPGGGSKKIEMTNEVEIVDGKLVASAIGRVWKP